MKRMLILSMLLLCLAALARAEGNLLLPLQEGEEVSELLTDGETLYILGDALTTWRGDDAAIQTWRDGIDLPGPEDEGDFRWRSAFEGLTLFMDGGTLRGGRLLVGEDGAAEALQLCDVVLTGAGTAEARNVQTLNVPAAVRDSGLSSVSALCAHGGALYLLGYGDDGAVLCAADSAEAKPVRAESLGWNEFHLLPAPDGPLLAEERYDEGTVLWRVAPDGALVKLCDLPPFTGAVAVDPATGTVFAELDGRVRPVDAAAGALGEAVSALPLEARGAAALHGGTRYAACMHGGVAVLSTANPLDEEGVVTYSATFNAAWLEETLLEFAVAHPDLALARVNAPMEDALDGMLTRSRDVDVYIADTGEGAAAYEALLNRGYMLPLERESLEAFFARVYPGFQRGTSRDGAPCALPVYLYGRGMGVSEALLGRLGLALSDVPDDWAGFLGFLENDIRPRLGDLGSDARFTYADMDAEGFRYYLRMAVLNGWVSSAALAGVAPDYADERLAALLERVDGMDFTAFGLPEKAADDGEDGFFGGGYSYGSGDRLLVQFSASYGFDDDGVEGTPLLLGFGDDLPGAMAFEATAAFVNPYTAHPDAALDLMEALLANLPARTRYALCPDLTEPVFDPGFERGAAYLQQAIEDCRARLDAAEAKDRQALEEELAAREREREDYEANNQWLIPSERLEWYRAHGDRACLKAPSWFEKDTSGEAWQLLEQYDAGLITARQFLAAVSQNARMMALEGE